ncbi:ATPase, T2SS/T4P/T4SS family [Lacticaseibacillus yichunensis]|uniref:ATPase, T2SS/T4P/T4SS family n=1 Tax=Lacticaseibacillus yichunensis TaxID=2486015 RepID=A0ABW4CPN0_9LACO|nr:ATPase, T2SS/T4P/T4SS family [Lacticaseibacillus yichunensis]
MDPVVRYLQQAVAESSSDVYLIPDGDDYQLVKRQPGGLSRRDPLSGEEGRRWLNTLKFAAGMNLVEQRRVQIGRLTLADVAAQMRLSTVGDHLDRETMVIRLLYGIPALDSYSRPLVESLVQASEGGGMIALAGPTGAGKTTLLYQVARELARNKMVLTIEDPVEILAPAFVQLQVNPQAGMTYEALLKAALRHRPDVLVIGEIRDRATAQAGIEAALSGHVVLTTIHARSAQGVAMRLQALGIAAPYVQAALRVSGYLQLAVEPVIHAQLDLLPAVEKRGLFGA